jgi:hypothetical protein
MKELFGGSGLATGTHAYHASGIATNAAAQALAAPCNTSTVHEGDGHGADSGAGHNMFSDGTDERNDDLDNQESDTEHATMPPPSSSIANTSTGSKRKYSALGTPLSEDSFSRPASASATPSSFSFSSASKRGRMSGAVALNRLGDTLSDFNQAFHTPRPPPPPSVDSAIERKRLAMERAQELETELSDDHLAALLELFQSDVSTADAYMVLKRDNLRKAWVRRKLELSDITFLGE